MRFFQGCVLVQNLQKHLFHNISSINIDTLVSSLHCLSLSSCQLESTFPPDAQLILSQSQHGDLVGYHVRLSNVLERVSRPSCELPTVNRKRFFMNILCVCFLPHRKPTTDCSSVLYSSSTVSTLTPETSL
jgi:hypothetical protein